MFEWFKRLFAKFKTDEQVIEEALKPDAEELNAMTKNELLSYAAASGIEVKKSWKKAVIIEKLLS